MLRLQGWLEADPKSEPACPSASDFWESSASGWIFDEEFPLDCFVEDGLEIGSGLFDPVLEIALRKIVHVRLQRRFVDRFQRFGCKLLNQVNLDLSRFLFCCFGPPVTLTER